MADNMVTLVGTLGTEPELRTTPQGSEVVSFRLATNERRRNPAGDGWIDGPTSWFRVSAWDRLGRNAHASLHKGQRVVVQGTLRIAEFTTEAHGTSRTAEVRAAALGHDLAHGTTGFTRNSRPEAQPAQPAEPVQPAPAAQLAAETRALEPVGGGWGAPLVPEDETPF